MARIGPTEVPQADVKLAFGARMTNFRQIATTGSRLTIGLGAGFVQGGGDGFNPRGHLAGWLAKGDPLVGTAVLDHAGRYDRAEDIGCAGQDALGAEQARELLDAVDTVLKGQNRGVGAKGRFERLSGGVGVVALDREERELEAVASLGRALDRFDRLDQERLATGAELDATLAQGGEVGAAGDKGDVVTGRASSPPKKPPTPPDPMMMMRMSMLLLTSGQWAVLGRQSSDGPRRTNRRHPTAHSSRHSASPRSSSYSLALRSKPIPGVLVGPRSRLRSGGRRRSRRRAGRCRGRTRCRPDRGRRRC